MCKNDGHFGQCEPWGWERKEPGSQANQPPGSKWDRVSPGLDTPRGENGAQLGHSLSLLWKEGSSQRDHLHFFFTFVLNLKLFAPKKSTLKGIQGKKQKTKTKTKKTPPESTKMVSIPPNKTQCGDKECSGPVLFLLDLQ